MIPPRTTGSLDFRAHKGRRVHRALRVLRDLPAGVLAATMDNVAGEELAARTFMDFRMRSGEPPTQSGAEMRTVRLPREPSRQWRGLTPKPLQQWHTSKNIRTPQLLRLCHRRRRRSSTLLRACAGSIPADK